MKLRNGFVSNSSSSSFIILLSNLTDEQKQMIYNHIEIGKKIDEYLKSEGKKIKYEWYEDWDIKEDDFSLWAYTSMDNFDLIDLVIEEVKVPQEHLLYYGDGDYFYNLYDDPDYNKLKRGLKLGKIDNNIKKLGDDNN